MVGIEGQFPKSSGDANYPSELNMYSGGSYADVKTYNLAVTTSTGNIDLSSVDYIYKILIRNTGLVGCYIDLDNTATTDGFYLQSEAEVILDNCNFEYVSAITSASSTTLSVIVYIGYNNYTGYKDEKEIVKLSSTDASSTIAFSDTTHYKDIIIINEGYNDAYISFTGTAATTDFKLIPGGVIIANTIKYDFSSICAAGLTTTIKILGVF